MQNEKDTIEKYLEQMADKEAGLASGETQSSGVQGKNERTSISAETLPLPVKRKKRQLSRTELFIRVGILCVLFGLVSSGAILGIEQYQKYSKALAQAKAGIQHLRNAETQLAKLSKNPFDSWSVNQAQQEFSSALSSFQQVSTDLNTLPAMSASVPGFGSKVIAAQHVLPLAIEISQMGVLACQTVNLLVPEIRNPMGATGPKLTQADLDTVSQNVQQIQSMLGVLLNQVNHLQPADLQLDPSLGKFVGTFRKDGPALQDALKQVQSILAVAPVLLGMNTPANYLIEILDSTELRPGGGFIGNYGLLSLSSAHLSNIFMTDVDLIDKPYEMAGGTIPYPPAYRWFDLAPNSWSFRDSNLDADFPTVARYGEQTYAQEGGKEPLQGVIAITPWFMQGVLNITGPIDMQPQYNEIVTAQNLIDRIHFHQLGKGKEGSELIPSPDGHSSLRKRFTAYLGDHVIARIRQIMGSSSASSSLFKLIIYSLHAKDIQIYFNSSTAESILQHNQLASTIQAPVGDSFFVVDANISPNKANDFIHYTEQDQITIDSAGNALHHTTLSYSWNIVGPQYGSDIYRDYVHIYVPPGSVLQTQNGWEPHGNSQAFGREVWEGLFTLTFGQTHTITLTWMAPKAAHLDTHGWHYQDLLQKQAGDQWNVNLQVTLPACATMRSLSGGLTARAKETAAFSGLQNEDKRFEIDYACA